MKRTAGMPGTSHLHVSQGDLFERAAWQPDPAVEKMVTDRTVKLQHLDGIALIAAIPMISRADCTAYVEEVLRRDMREAIPSLEQLCRRFKGYGRHHRIHEQIIALEALTSLGGPEASDSVLRMVSEQIIEGPAVQNALAAAVTLMVRLPYDCVIAYLRHPDPGVRALACHLALFWSRTENVLNELLDDLHREVMEAAAITLGRMGNPIARPPLLAMLARSPSKDIVTALAEIADDDILVLLGRIAAAKPGALRDDVIEALDRSDHPRAAAVRRNLHRASHDPLHGTTPYP